VGHDLQFSYRLPKNMTVFASGRNIFNRSQASYVQAEGSKRIITDHRNYGGLWTLGVRGEF
jgi:outer membrane receptor protein involved in Fe transport